MVVYGVALLSACMLAGLVVGDLLGLLIGVKANVGGVGIAMLLLILFSDHLKRTLRMNALAEQGILFWSAMYIPIVVAMAAGVPLVGVAVAIRPDSPWYAIVPGLFVYGFGVGLATAQLTNVVLQDVPVVESVHPSPLSASRGFFGSRPFSRANALLEELGDDGIDWRL